MPRRRRPTFAAQPPLFRKRRFAPEIWDRSASRPYLGERWERRTIGRCGSDWICSVSVAISVSRRSAVFTFRGVSVSTESLPIGGRRPPLQGACGAMASTLVCSAVIDAPLQREMSLIPQRNDARAVPAMPVRPRVFLKRPIALARTAENFPA